MTDRDSPDPDEAKFGSVPDEDVDEALPEEDYDEDRPLGEVPAG